jgi:hypothetical protein
MPTSSIASALSSVAIGSAVTFLNLTMYPLVRQDESSAPLRYLVLDDALASGAVEITEVSEQGRVPELRVVNRGADPVLIVDGEELVGAKQNRVVNLTILVAANSELTIPVSCVEAGRWRARSRAFSSAPRTQYATGRAKRMAQVTQSMSAGHYSSDQSDVWADIAEKSARLKSSSPTGAMEALFVDHASFIDQCVAALGPVDGQTGALFAVDGRVLGFDLFESAAVLRKLLAKLVRAAAVDAVDTDATPSVVSPHGSEGPSEFLTAVAATSSQFSPALGLGEDVRLSGAGVTGAGLISSGHLLHFGAFAIPPRD